MFRHLFLIFIIGFIPFSFPQYKLISYIEKGNNITLRISLDTCKLSAMTSSDTKFLADGFYDESLPGEYALPAKEVFIGIPFQSDIEITSSIMNQNTYRHNLSLNPSVVKVNDSLLSYNHSGIKKESSLTNRITLKGFLWINNIYSAHLTINQYSYDEIKRMIHEITELEITIRFNSDLPLVENTNNRRWGVEKNILINPSYAEKYSVLNVPFLGDTTDSWINYNENYIKILIAENGIYRIRYEDLEILSIIDPMTINIYKDGSKVPIFILGEENRLLEPGEYIEFYGIRKSGGNHRLTNSSSEPYNEFNGRYSDSSVYWLTWNDTIPCRVNLSGGGLINSLDTLYYYNSVIHVEKNNWFDFSSPDLVKKEMPYWLGNKTWGWAAFGTGKREFNFITSDVYPEREFSIYAKLHSYASGVQNDAHLLAVSLNDDNRWYDSIYINKYEQKVLSAQLNSDSLRDGTNTFKFISLPTASNINSIFFDWYEIEYPRYINLTDDSLSFSFNSLQFPEVRTIKISGAQSTKYLIWKRGLRYEKYYDYLINNGCIYLTDTISPGDEFVIIYENKIKTPVIKYQKKFSNLRKPVQSDYIIITSKIFYAKAEEYCSFISTAYNMSTRVIDIDDIYDEYCYGNIDPEGIKNFLQSAYALYPPPLPEYLFIVGDATYDYHRNKEIFQGMPQKTNIVPSYGAPVSDNWFTIWDTTGANISNVNIGRLPVNSLQEFDNYFIKHNLYLSKKYNEWNKRYLFFSGGNSDNPGQLEQLKAINDMVITDLVGTYPIGGNFAHFYKTTNPISNFGPYPNEYIQGVIDSSALFISYIGHSGTQTWDNSIVDPGQLHNSINASPLITDFGCSTGKFAEPDIVSFSELFVTGERGEAIAYIGNSSLGFLSTSMVFPYLFYKKILMDSVYTINKAFRLAKIDMMKTYGSTGVYKLFALTSTYIGDPVIKLPIPLMPNLKINNSNVSFSNEVPSDQDEFVEMTVNYFNYGRVVIDSFTVNIKCDYNGEASYDSSFLVIIPKFSASLNTSIPLKHKAGEHKISINLDAGNRIDEIYEDDNFVSLKLNVFSSELRLLDDYYSESGIKDSLIILNPSFIHSESKMEFEFSDNEKFINSIKKSVKLNSFFTALPLKDITGTGRKWIRGKVSENTSHSFVRSVYAGTEFKYLLDDSLSFSGTELQGLSVSGNKVSVDTAAISFTVISAGFHDGKTAVISKNGQTYVPMGNVIGHHVCLFDADTYEFITYRHFNLFSGGAGVTSDYYNFLDTLNSNYIVMAAVADEGRAVDSLKLLLKEFGSVFIDSLQFRSSWAFTGKRGSPPGLLPEAFSKAFNGRVRTDTSIKNLNSSGRFLTSAAGPASAWDILRIIKNQPPGTSVNIRAIGINKNGTADTLAFFPSGINNINLSNTGYPFIKLEGFLSGSGSALPDIQMLGVKYAGPAELGLNSASVSIKNDTITQGETALLKIDLHNAGETSAEDFLINVEASGSSNFSEQAASITVNELLPGEMKTFNISYQPAEREGNMRFNITADAGNIIFEKYKDNNFFSIPFFVKKDENPPEVKILFDKRELMEGDYVSAQPEIIIELYDESPLPFDDPAMLQFYLNGREIIYEGESDTLTCTFGSEPKIKITYKPKLPYGENTIAAAGKDAAGNAAPGADIPLRFFVSGEMKLLNVCNYPNPFSSSTNFTFILTQLPDEMEIRIYTVAGRLIKKITNIYPLLRFGFNSIPWDGRDEEGSNPANGTYLYKLIIKNGEKGEAAVGKMSVVR